MGYICVGYAIRGWQLGWRDRAAGDLSPGQGQGGHGGHQVSFILHHQNAEHPWYLTFGNSEVVPDLHYGRLLDAESAWRIRIRI